MKTKSQWETTLEEKLSDAVGAIVDWLDFARHNVLEVTLAGLLVVLVATLVLFIAERTVFSEPVPGQGVILDLRYSAAESETGTGLVVNPSDGSVGVTTTTSSSSEKWNVIIDNGSEIVTARAEPRTFYALEIGQTVEYSRIVGRVSGITWGYVVEQP